MVEPTAQDPKRTPGWVKVLLGLSLALNLAIVGVVAGAALRQSKGPPGGARGNFGPAFVSALDPADQRTLLRDMRRGRDDVRADQRDQMRLLVEVLRADAFDTDAARKMINTRAQISRAAQSGAHAKWLEIVTGMAPEARARYADRLEQALDRGPRKRRR